MNRLTGESNADPAGDANGQQAFAADQLNRAKGLAIASGGDPGPELSVASRTVSPVSFQPRNRMTVSGMLVIIAAVLLATALGVGRTGMVVVVVAITFLVGIVLVINNLLRWEHAENAFEKERASAANWNTRFRKLYSDSARTNAVLSHMIDGIVMLSPTTEILLINEAALRLLAIPGDGVYLGRRLAELVRIPEINRAAEKTQFENVDQSVSVEVVDGATVRPVAVRISRIHDARPPHLLLVLRDETEAQRVEAIRREFIANVSHELKTPLAAIKGYAETVELAIEDDPDAAKHFIGQIDTQCKRLEDLIADMMRLARAQSGKAMLVVQKIDLQKVVSRAMESFLPVANAKQIDLKVHPSADHVHVLADEEAALAITQNLISNALRHTEAQGTVSVAYRRENSGWVLVVQDDGVGIAEEYQDRIFERFYRVDRTRKSADGGTGIGLSIVKNLSRALGGNVCVISSPGEGAAFEVWLPAAK